jgi:hypothetical protein
MGGEGSRSSGLVNCSLMTDYTLRHCSSGTIARQGIVLCLGSCWSHLTVVC